MGRSAGKNNDTNSTGRSAKPSSSGSVSSGRSARPSSSSGRSAKPIAQDQPKAKKARPAKPRLEDFIPAAVVEEPAIERPTRKPHRLFKRKQDTKQNISDNVVINVNVVQNGSIEQPTATAQEPITTQSRLSASDTRRLRALKAAEASQEFIDPSETPMIENPRDSILLSGQVASGQDETTIAQQPHASESQPPSDQRSTTIKDADQFAFGISCLGCLGTIILSIVLCAILGFVFTSTSLSSLTETYKRTPLKQEAVFTRSFFDDDGDWINDPAKLNSAMKQFYDETGVVPYLWIKPNGSTSSKTQFRSEAAIKATRVFDDQKYFLVLFCDDDQGGYDVVTKVGYDAKRVMDEEAVNVFLSNLYANYMDFDLDETEIFANTFTETANLIMSEKNAAHVPLIMIFGAILTSAVLMLLICGFANGHHQKKKRAQELTNTPIEKYSDMYVEELAKKYEGDDTNPSAP